MKNLQKFFFAAGLMIVAACLMFTSCTKEGPQGLTGPAGKDGTNGTNGTNGKDANETCKICHTATVVDRIAVEFQLSKHSWGEAAFEEAGNTTCAPCHEQKGLVYVCQNNTSSEFLLVNNAWVNQYTVPADAAIGEIGCWTCHSSLHTTYGETDLALTSVAPVSMTMWGGAKTIDLPADGGSGNLCAKCHQPRPFTCSADPSATAKTRLLNYDSLKNFPLVVMWDSTTGAVNKYVRPSYRMHVHYGAVGAVVAGVGAIEYPGLIYSNSPHTTLASCSDCHMANPMTGIAGGHAFNVRNAKESALGTNTTWNFNGCNVEGCHAADPLSKTHAMWVNTRTIVKGLLEELAAKINACGNGHDILHKDASASNLWWGLTTNNYDGYMDIYDASVNPNGYWKLTSQPKFPQLLNVQMGAIINFQFCLREYSLGIHNSDYVIALMTNTIEAMEDAGF
jgi:hypothetical protein